MCSSLFARFSWLPECNSKLKKIPISVTAYNGHPYVRFCGGPENLQSKSASVVVAVVVATRESRLCRQLAGHLVRGRTRTYSLASRCFVSFRVIARQRRLPIWTNTLDHPKSATNLEIREGLSLRWRTIIIHAAPTSIRTTPTCRISEKWRSVAIREWTRKNHQERLRARFSNKMNLYLEIEIHSFRSITGQSRKSEELVVSST